MSFVLLLQSDEHGSMYRGVRPGNTYLVSTTQKTSLRLYTMSLFFLPTLSW